MRDIILNEFQAHKKVIEATIKMLIPVVEEAANISINTLKNGNKIYHQ